MKEQDRNLEYFDDLDKVSYWQDEFEGIFDNETK